VFAAWSLFTSYSQFLVSVARRKATTKKTYRVRKPELNRVFHESNDIPFALLMKPWNAASEFISCNATRDFMKDSSSLDFGNGLTPYHAPKDSKLCLAVAFISARDHREFSADILQVDMSLISYNSIIAPKLEQCFPYKGNNNIQFVCTYTVTFTETGNYNVSLRGDFFLVPDMVNSTGAFDGLGDYMGRFRELRSLQLQQIVVQKGRLKSSRANTSFSNSNLPFCTFKHEMQMRQGNGDPQWKRLPDMSIQDESRLRKIWYNDSYIWVNNICRYKPFTGDEILEEMDKKNISKILLVGDSLSRFMWGDFEDQFSHCTQEWLLQNPIVFEKGETGAKTSWDNALSSAGGFGSYFNKTGQCFRQTGIIPLAECCRSYSCPNHNGVVVIRQFLPGFMGPAQTDLIMPPNKRSVDEWEAVFKVFIDDEWPVIPQFIVFNAGLWLINAYREDSVNELQKMISAWMKLCKKFNIRFVWRSTFYHHRSLTMNRLIKTSNDAAIELLVTKFNHSLFLDSNYYMSMLRPDRTVDSFHYNYRMLRSSWHRCEEKDFKSLDPDCVRDMSWPMAVAKATTLSLVNAILNSP
jgi:hypothetical protein